VESKWKRYSGSNPANIQNCSQLYPLHLRSHFLKNRRVWYNMYYCFLPPPKQIWRKCHKLKKIFQNDAREKSTFARTFWRKCHFSEESAIIYDDFWRKCRLFEESAMLNLKYKRMPWNWRKWYETEENAAFKFDKLRLKYFDETKLGWHKREILRRREKY